MNIIKFILILSLLTVLINLFRTTSKNKIIFNIFISSILIIKLSDDLDNLIINAMTYLCFVYIILNIYTTRYSSIRMSLMSAIINKRKILTEEKLFQERIKRFEKNNKSIMSYNLFYATDKLVNIFRKFFL
tara:strand:- start:158 stop:550 length:393 start_codon:yes stop_codon:yes gene_type:complete